MPNISIEQIEKIKAALSFYANEENFEWEGCSCHGKYILLDRGDKANDGLQVITELEHWDCPECKETGQKIGEPCEICKHPSP